MWDLYIVRLVDFARLTHKKNGNPLTQSPGFKNPNMLDKGISEAFEKAKKTKSNLLDDSKSCIEAVSEQYEQDHPGKTLPVS
uniref:Uncharacterized protein n=1 Tax=Erwinia amylovora ATCC BAA-2158 TaxID=889211 RepID=E5B2H1_ERWAM|nr:hypothetical protein EAIL5_0853 [Erwinia amylovora ATCC BAA-2158]